MADTALETTNTEDHTGLKDVPVDNGWPLVGNTIRAVSDPVGEAKRLMRKYGMVYGSRTFGQTVISMHSPEAAEFILMNRDGSFSNEMGWEPWLGRLFPKGLMLMDGMEHKAHRRIMGTAFKTAPMKHYLEGLNDEMPARMDAWGKDGNFAFYPAVKELTLDMASRVFLGLEKGEESEKVNQALTDMVAASITFVRVPIPGSQMKKGVDARAFMSRFLKEQIPLRRERGGDDMFSQLCTAESEDGERFTDQEIIDHMNFLWMAAHDTITSSMTTLVYRLGRHTDWQDKLREEIASLGMNDGRLQYDMLGQMELTDMAFKEALRLNPPVPMMPRRVVKETSFDGYRIPKGAVVSVAPLFAHKDKNQWENPYDFDPMRFTPDASKGRHKYAWIPYGGGVHMCLGLHFAVMQAKTILAHLLPRFDIALDCDEKVDFQIMPLIKPTNGLPVRMTPRTES